MLTATFWFFLGVFLAPIVRPLLRPLFVEAIRATLMTADEVRRLTANVRENIEDAAAEAQAERDAKAARQPEPGYPADAPPPPPPVASAPPPSPPPV